MPATGELPAHGGEVRTTHCRSQRRGLPQAQSTHPQRATTARNPSAPTTPTAHRPADPRPRRQTRSCSVSAPPAVVHAGGGTHAAFSRGPAGPSLQYSDTRPGRRPAEGPRPAAVAPHSPARGTAPGRTHRVARDPPPEQPLRWPPLPLASPPRTAHPGQINRPIRQRRAARHGERSSRRPGALRRPLNRSLSVSRGTPQKTSTASPGSGTGLRALERYRAKELVQHGTSYARACTASTVQGRLRRRRHCPRRCAQCRRTYRRTRGR
ncbi:hypothetical protein SAMN05216467_3573 [Cellulomonas sp. KH9]|nr:hypothetical protein SAMN05216467_3573 [Cellulomonas sp. KH9]